MITQIEIDGFKTFKDFKVELAPFQVIVGANGSGKSNLFDALHLLSRLAEVDIRTAFQELRGDVHELFTVLPNGQRTERIFLAVEMLVDQKLQDSLGEETELTYVRLRYEVVIIRRTDEHGLAQLQITHEALKFIPKEEDIWRKKYETPSQMNGLAKRIGHTLPFIETFNSRPATPTLIEPLTIHLYSDGEGQEKEYLAEKVQRTVLSTIIHLNYPHIFAAREEMRSWRFLSLDPKELRKPSSIYATPFLTRDGGNLAAMLVRMQNEDSFAMTGVSSDMANLIPGILDIKVEENRARNEYDIWATTDDGLFLPANVLSDGTLRLLALAALRNDAQFHGVLCLEEPENGVNPSSMKEVAHLLKGLATDFKSLYGPTPTNELLNQVIVTTHSPIFISQPDARDSLLFAYLVMDIDPASNSPSLHITCMTPVMTVATNSLLKMNEDRDEVMEIYTIDQVKKYLNNEAFDEARKQLEKARTILNEG